MKMKYVTGMITGVLVGAVMAGVWLITRPRPSVYRLAWRGASQMAPKAWKVAKVGGRELIHLAKRRLG